MLISLGGNYYVLHVSGTNDVPRSGEIHKFFYFPFPVIDTIDNKTRPQVKENLENIKCSNISLTLNLTLQIIAF